MSLWWSVRGGALKREQQGKTRFHRRVGFCGEDSLISSPAGAPHLRTAPQPPPAPTAHYSRRLLSSITCLEAEEAAVSSRGAGCFSASRRLLCAQVFFFQQTIRKSGSSPLCSRWRRVLGKKKSSAVDSLGAAPTANRRSCASIRACLCVCTRVFARTRPRSDLFQSARARPGRLCAPVKGALAPCVLVNSRANC